MNTTEFFHEKTVFISKEALQKWNNTFAVLLRLIGGFGKLSYPLTYDLRKGTKPSVRERMEKVLSPSLFGDSVSGLSLHHKGYYYYGIQLPNGQIVAYEVYKEGRDQIVRSEYLTITAPDSEMPEAGVLAYREWFEKTILNKPSKYLDQELVDGLDFIMSNVNKEFVSNKQRHFFRHRMIQFLDFIKGHGQVLVQKERIRKSKDGKWVNGIEVHFEIPELQYQFQLKLNYKQLQGSYTKGEYLRRAKEGEIFWPWR